MTSDEIRTNAMDLLYTEATFPPLGAAIDEVMSKNDASKFAEYTLILLSPSETRGVYNNSITFSNIGIVCQDWYHSDQSAADIQLKYTIAKAQAPLMMAFSPTYRLFQLNCIGWPTNGHNPSHRISVTKTANFPKVLIVESLYDPATSLVWGAQLREEIGVDRTVMVIKNMTGHAVYEQAGSIGGDTAAVIEQYLVNLVLPEEGTIHQS
ncbi:hypothetical protein AAE478_010081 [Parahypoxylon ruwenzoriense]